MRIPKAIATHPGVLECCSGPDSGVEEYRYDVFLKEGWYYQNGRMAGGRCGHFNTVADFKYANPTNATNGDTA